MNQDQSCRITSQGERNLYQNDSTQQYERPQHEGQLNDTNEAVQDLSCQNDNQQMSGSVDIYNQSNYRQNTQLDYDGYQPDKYYETCLEKQEDHKNLEDSSQTNSYKSNQRQSDSGSTSHFSENQMDIEDEESKAFSLSFIDRDSEEEKSQENILTEVSNLSKELKKEFKIQSQSFFQEVQEQFNQIREDLLDSDQIKEKASKFLNIFNLYQNNNKFSMANSFAWFLKQTCCNSTENIVWKDMYIKYLLFILKCKEKTNDQLREQIVEIFNEVKYVEQNFNINFKMESDNFFNEAKIEYFDKIDENSYYNIDNRDFSELKNEDNASSLLNIIQLHEKIQNKKKAFAFFKKYLINFKNNEQYSNENENECIYFMLLLFILKNKEQLIYNY